MTFPSTQLSYRSYWHNTIVETILKRVEEVGRVDSNAFLADEDSDELDTQTTISIMDLCELTSIKKEDIITTLQVSQAAWSASPTCSGERNVRVRSWRERDPPNERDDRRVPALAEEALHPHRPGGHPVDAEELGPAQNLTVDLARLPSPL